MAAEKVIVYRSIAEQRQDEYWQKFLDMNPWVSAVLFYGCVAAIGGIVLYTLYSMLRNRRW